MKALCVDAAGPKISPEYLCWCRYMNTWVIRETDVNLDITTFGDLGLEDE